MIKNGEVTIDRSGRQYGATYTVSADGMLHLKTHTETRSLELGAQDADELARRILIEIVNAQSSDKFG